jgi:quercetin dioxygenase-like cupin family protein
MESYNLKNMVKGWFVGNFEPTVLKTDACEVSVKTYIKGESESSHFHKIATEVTVIISGTVKMAGKIWSAGDIIVMHPGDVTSFEAITDAVNVVVKIPGSNNDKYLADDHV